MDRSAPILARILAETSQCLQQSHDVLMVFDLDSTLFDVSPRIQQILRDFSNQPAIRELDPEGAKILSQLTAHRKDWGIRAAIERAGLIATKPQLAERVRDFWVRNFFSNEDLPFDQPLEGAVEFVNLDQVRLKHPEVALVFVDTTHSSKIPSPTDLKTIDDFTLDWRRLALKRPARHAALIR